MTNKAILIVYFFKRKSFLSSFNKSKTFELTYTSCDRYPNIPWKKRDKQYNKEKIKISFPPLIRET